MGCRNRQVNDDLDVRILEQLVNRASTGDVILLGLLLRPVQVEVGAGDEIKRFESLRKSPCRCR